VLIELTPESETFLRSLTVAHRDELKRLAPLLRSLLNEFDTERNDERSPARARPIK
jgi:hypothetical protein